MSSSSSSSKTAAAAASAAEQALASPNLSDAEFDLEYKKRMFKGLVQNRAALVQQATVAKAVGAAMPMPLISLLQIHKAHLNTLMKDIEALVDYPEADSYRASLIALYAQFMNLLCDTKRAALSAVSSSAGAAPSQ